MKDMGLRGEDFDCLHPKNQAIIIRAKGIPVIELKLPEENCLVLYSLYNYFVEAVVNKPEEEIKFIERLTLDQVVNTYCEDIPSLET